MNISIAIAKRSNGSFRWLCRGLAALAISGCTTLAPTQEAIVPFRQGVATAEQQTSRTFADVNALLRTQQIERAVKQDTLSEAEFVPGLDAQDLAKWARAFGMIDAYAEKVERLLSPDRRAGVEQELSQLGATVEKVSGEQLPTGIAAAFVDLGGLLVQIKAGEDALAAIRKADPAIQDIFSAMMAAIGPDSGSGVRGTVRDTWGVMVDRITVEYLRANGDAARRAVILRFIDALDRRDQQDQVLSSLRVSIASLAKAHQEIAQGRPASAAALIRIVQQEYQAYREQAAAMLKQRASGATEGASP